MKLDAFQCFQKLIKSIKLTKIAISVGLIKLNFAQVAIPLAVAGHSESSLLRGLTTE